MIHMYVYITHKLNARKKRADGTDCGSRPLNPGKYFAKRTNDGALAIFEDADEPVYLLPFFWWEMMEKGDLLLEGFA